MNIAGLGRGLVVAGLSKPRSSAAFVLVLALTVCHEARAQPDTPDRDRFSTLYDAATLARWKARYGPHIQANLESLILPLLSTHERSRLAGLELQLVLTDERDLFSYRAVSQPPTIYMSTNSIKFFDDLAITTAWLALNNYSIESVAYYAAVLKHRAPSQFAGGRHPQPLAALGIPRNALDDTVVDDVSQKTLKGAITFVLAHELGHLVHGHAPIGSPAERQRREMEADAFATNMFRRIGVPPAGIETFFFVATYLLPNRGNFDSDEAWTRYVQTSSHPLSGRRLAALASALRTRPQDFARLEPNLGAALERLRFMAAQLEGLVPLLDDPLLQRHTTIVGLQIPLTELRPRRPGSSWVPPGTR